MNKNNVALNNLTQRTMRGPRTSVYQQMLAQKLIKANMTPQPLHKIRYTCEAAFLCKNKNKLNMGQIQAINNVTQSLLNTYTPKADSDHSTEIAWNFPKTETNYKYHIAPWQKIQLSYYPMDTELRLRKQRNHNQYTDTQMLNLKTKNIVTQEIHKEILTLPKHQHFFEITGSLDSLSYSRIKAEFEGWAVPLMLEAMAIMVYEIDPKIYSETLATMYSQEQEK